MVNQLFLQQKHMSGYKLQRSFVIEKEISLQTQIIKGEIQVQDGFGDLRSILIQIGDPDECTFKIYDFSDNRYHRIRDYSNDFEKDCQVPAQLLRTEIVLLKFSQDESQTNSIKSGSRSAASDASSNKKERSKERTIAEVIQIVKQWRDLHMTTTNGRKLNLQEAAEMLGISKKSLDDYYYQLRLGEKYDFDFKIHMNEKVGVLRTFIKDIKPKKKDSYLKLEKHPKKLKIIEQLGQYQIQEKKSKSKKSNKSKNQQDLQLDLNNQLQKNQIEKDENADKKSIKSIQNQFYNEFQFMGEEPLDPFLNFEGGFKKKPFDDMSQQFFF